MNVHRAVIEAGEQESGITIHYVNEQYDSGDIIFQARPKSSKTTHRKNWPKESMPSNTNTTPR